ncbi:MAG: hypothetical protein MUP53_09145 [Bacteroidales bacterium]|nr:hypothetical protein [Bacteroidales bacterium]
MPIKTCMGYVARDLWCRMWFEVRGMGRGHTAFQFRVPLCPCSFFSPLLPFPHSPLQPSRSHALLDDEAISHPPNK